ncbi:hypothetical protein GCM10007874_46010 [Labrys miyagiensis]|uniref:OsmC family peroxiredoxin n=1 Tax=Labrys miyagiensis TaxID=346912 RepID=A0ABQ6CS82_9HYPH|nr:OsmC family protein [Labrys miyagiensis]GLS21584.1 hypothetical protein GCM10007874_46010 [Labrys miyagiensis]
MRTVDQKQDYQKSGAWLCLAGDLASKCGLCRMSLDWTGSTVLRWALLVTSGRRGWSSHSAGGDGSLACSADMLLEAVAACAGVTFRAVATASGVKIRSGQVIAEGKWDARGTLGVDRSVPVGLTEITLRFEVDSDADPAKLARMIQTTENYCVILQTLRNPPRIRVE